MDVYDESTPCPGPIRFGTTSGQEHTFNFAPGSRIGGMPARKPRRSVQVAQNDTTETIDFTTEFRASMRNIAPRRRISTKIPEERDENPSQPGHNLTQSPPVDGACPARRTSMLTKPAARAPSVLDAAKPRRRRVSAMLAEMDHGKVQAGSGLTAPPQRLDKDVRRRTIYIQQDDTTITTNFNHGTVSEPQARGKRDENSINVLGSRGLNVVKEQDENVPSQSLEKTSFKKPPRKSLAVAPRKAPLQQSMHNWQANALPTDHVGQGRGKENVPPGGSLNRPKRQSVGENAFKIKTEKPAVQFKTEPPDHSNKDAKGTGSRKRVHRLNEDKYVSKATKLDNHDVRPPEPRPRSKLSVPLINVSQYDKDAYPVLSEDILHPEMYEDQWLVHQEAAITQLINSLFDTAKEANTPSNHTALRKKLLGIYQDSSMALLHKRLQASLLYGGLKLSKDVLSRCTSLHEDISSRRQFLDLWMSAYDHSILRAAAEIVIGRESQRKSISQRSTSTRSDAKSLESFLETFLLRNEDAIQMRSDVGSIRSLARGTVGGLSMPDRATAELQRKESMWTRTTLRSLMLVLLIDRAKQSGETVSSCIFSRASAYKSSTSVLQGLSSLLLPSIGDVTRPLAHLNFDVSHVQTPLAEHDFHITNLATDMRDGVLLTRMVELLLNPPDSLPCDRDTSETTVTMPTGDTFTMVRSGCDLTGHLKIPCHARAQKLFNVQVALSALEEVGKGASTTLNGVRAEDIVDGHREKTVGLLWGLVSRWGLSLIVDWPQLEREVSRLRRQLHEEHGLPENDEDDDDFAAIDGDDNTEFSNRPERYTKLLKAWASAIATLHGLKVLNLTTSFADGLVFSKIVEQYENCVPTSTPAGADLVPLAGNSASASGPLSGEKISLNLESRLRGLGCSGFFASLFGRANQGRILDKQFVIASLAFLCSRLLQSSVTERAAQTIQRAYRTLLQRRSLHRRVICMRLARDSQTVVMMRDRVVNAATTLQRAWRSYRHI